MTSMTEGHTPSPKARKPRQRGFWIPYLFFGMFGIIIAVNASLIYWAVTTFPGLSSDRHYERGLAYNEVLEAQRQQAALGWRVAADLGEPLDGVARLEVALKDKEGQPLYAENVTATLQRPTVEGMDSSMAMIPVGPGVYRADASVPLPGVWDLILQVERGQDRHVSKQRLYVKP